MSRANRPTIRPLAVVLLAAISAGAGGQPLDKRRADWLDPDLAGFILKNADQLRYEIIYAEGPRLESLLHQLRLIDTKINIECVQQIELAENNAYSLYSGLINTEARCSG